MKERKIILRQGQSPGDIIVFTGAVRDLKLSFPQFQIDVRSPCNEVFEANPHLTKLDEKDKDVEVYEIGYASIDQCGWRCHHFSDAFREELQEKINSRCPNKIKIKKTSILPDLHLAKVEKEWTNQVAMTFQYPGKFWLLNAGSKKDNPLKQYPPHLYQEVVNKLSDRIQFVQIGHKDHEHPKLEGVFNLVGKTDLREMIRLMYWAEGVITPISMPMVLAAAWQKPAVVIAGGKESPTWQMYPNHRFLYTNGALKCCQYGGCWKSEFKDCVNRVGSHPRCFVMIRPDDIVNAVDMYYKGGALSYDHYFVNDWRPHATESKVGEDSGTDSNVQDA